MLRGAPVKSTTHNNYHKVFVLTVNNIEENIPGLRVFCIFRSKRYKRRPSASWACLHYTLDSNSLEFYRPSVIVMVPLLFSFDILL